MSVQNEMERIGRITAADQQLEVHVRGVQAYAVSGAVTIPNIETYEWLGRNAYRMLHGLLDHECGHAVDTDFGALKEFGQRSQPPALVLLQNIVEDGYVERLSGRRYVGCGQNIALMNEWFYKRENKESKTLMERVADETNDAWESFLIALGTVLTPYGHHDIEFYKNLNTRVYQMLCECRADIEEAQAILHTKATAQNIEIAKRIYERFHQKEEEKEQESSSDDEGEEEDSSDKKGEESKPGEDENKSGAEEDEDAESGEGDEETDDEESGEESGEGSGDGEESEEESAEENGDGEGQSEAGSDENEEGDSSETGSGKGEGAGECESDEVPPELLMDLERWAPDSDQPLNASDQINVIIRDVFEKSDAELPPYTNFSHEFDAFRDFSSEDLSEASAYYDQEMEAALSTAEGLVQCFEVALLATEMARPVGGNDEGEIDPTALVEYAVGSLPADQLYTQFAETDAKDVVVAILCDCSGSMMGQKQKLCRRAAMALSYALRQVQIPNEVSGFTTLHSGDTFRHVWARDKVAEYDANFQAMGVALEEAQEHGTDIRRFAREICGMRGSALTATLCVPFNVRFKSFESEDARGLIHVTAIAENLDGESVLWQAQRLAERSERRKVLFVLSDGLPAGSRDNEQGARYLKEVINRVVESGIEVYGLGIQSDYVQEYYPEWWVCHDLDDLTEVAMGGLIEVLTKNRTERNRVFL